MKPVTYTSACATCHPLSVWLAGVLDGSVAEEFLRPALHAEPKMVIAELRDRLSRSIDRAPAMLRAGPPVIPRWPLRDIEPRLDDKPSEWVERQLRDLKRQLFDLGGGCKACHIPGPLKDGAPSFEPTDIPARSLRRAVFSHYAHRQSECLVCHAVAASKSPAVLKSPSIHDCANCHVDGSPRRAFEVQASCRDCHVYHPPDQKPKNLLELLGR
jgi:predicted CXXCH cytochrome family protein